MTFTARLDAIHPAGQPGAIDVDLTYLDSTAPDWSIVKTLRITYDSSQTAAQQRTAIQAQISADGLLYKQQLAVNAALAALIGQSITI